MKCSPMDIQEPFEFRRQNLFEFKMKSEKYRECEDSDKEELNDEDIRLNKPYRDGRKFEYLLSKREVKCMAMNISGIDKHACKSVKNIPSEVRVNGIFWSINELTKFVWHLVLHSYSLPCTGFRNCCNRYANMAFDKPLNTNKINIQNQ